MTATTAQGVSADPPLSASISEILAAKQRAAEAADARMYGAGTNETGGVDGVLGKLLSVVRAHPLQSLGVAIALGLTAAALLRRR